MNQLDRFIVFTSTVVVVHCKCNMLLTTADLIYGVWIATWLLASMSRGTAICGLAAVSRSLPRSSVHQPHKKCLDYFPDKNNNDD